MARLNRITAEQSARDAVREDLRSTETRRRPSLENFIKTGSFPLCAYLSVTARFPGRFHRSPDDAWTRHERRSQIERLILAEVGEANQCAIGDTAGGVRTAQGSGLIPQPHARCVHALCCTLSDGSQLDPARLAAAGWRTSAEPALNRNGRAGEKARFRRCQSDS